MTRDSVNLYIKKKYGTPPEYPWREYPGYAVYRHGDCRKWFAVIMNIKKSKLGEGGDSVVDVMNLKCDPFLIGSLVCDEGIYPAYHMNKTYWISVLLDGTVDDDKVKWLVDISYDLTAKK